MDLYALEQQIKRAEADLAEEVRLGEVYPSAFVALKVERLYRTVGALQRRRNGMLKDLKRGNPHVVPTNTWRKSRETKWAQEEEDGLEEFGYRMVAPSLPVPEGPAWYRRTERWLEPREETGEGEWVWKGRAIQVMDNVLYNDADLFAKLLQKTEQLDAKLNGLGRKSDKGVTELEQSWSDETKEKVQVGEALGEERIRARELARRHLEERAEMLKKEMAHNAAVSVQSVFRGHLGRKMMRRAKAEYDSKIRHEGAVIIQSKFRGFLARREFARERAQANHETEEAAVMVLQSQFRGTLARKEFNHAKTKKERQKYAACMIQAWWRGITARRDIHEIQSKYRREAEEMAAVMLQCAWRCRQARKEKDILFGERERAMEEAAAVMVQAAWRGHQARKRVKVIRSELTEVDHKLKSMDYADRVKVNFFAKKFMNNKQRAAALIQAHARGYLERKRVKNLRKRKQEDDEIERMLQQNRRANAHVVVFDQEVRIPIDWADGAQELASVNVLIREFKQPYSLRFEVVHQRTRFSRKLDISVLEQLLYPLFAQDENLGTSGNKKSKKKLEKDTKNLMGWVLEGKTLKRKHLITWILNRMWLEQETSTSPLELHLGSGSTKSHETQLLDSKLTTALPPASPPSPKPDLKSSGRVRDSFVVRYAK